MIMIVKHVSRRQQQEEEFAAWMHVATVRKIIDVISRAITAGGRRRCPELVSADLFPPQKSHHHFNPLPVQRTQRPLIQWLYFGVSSLHQRPEPALAVVQQNLCCFSLTRFPCSARISACSSLLWIWCSLLDFTNMGPSAAAGRSCRWKTSAVTLTGGSLRSDRISDAHLSVLTFSFKVLRCLEEQLRGPSVTTSTG